MTDISLPPYPSNVEQAKQQANDLAYGFEKHAGDYWNNLYAQDPEYAWKRMLGWQAGPEDAANFGLYANPPSPWHGSVTPPVPVPDPPPPAVDVVARLDAIDRALAEVRGLIVAVGQKPAPSYDGTAANRYLGTVSFHLTPK